MPIECIRACDHAQTVPAAIARDTLNYASWGGALPLSQYLAREAQLWRHPFSQRGLRLWLLRQGDRVLASCETYAVPLHQTFPGQPTVPGTAYGVASVYVAEPLRGRGYASELLRGVQAQLAEEGAACSYLMSEVNPAIYERLGYVTRGVVARRYPAQPQPPAAGVEWLPLASLDADLLRLPDAPLVLQLDPEFVLWHIERGRFHAGCLHAPPQTILGARVGGTWAVCADEPREGLLRLLALRGAAEPDELGDVLAALQHLAWRQRLAQVELWQNDSNRHFPWPPGGTAQGAEATPMLCPLRAGIVAADWQTVERGLWL